MIKKLSVLSYIGRAFLLALMLGVIAVCASGCGKDSEGEPAARSDGLLPSTPPKTTTEAREPAPTSTSTADEGYVDPAKCFQDVGALTVSTRRALASIDPDDLEVENAGTTRTGKHPIAFQNVRGRPYRVYMVGGYSAAANERQLRISKQRALRSPGRLAYVGFLPPPASKTAVKAGLDCLDGYRGR